MVLAAAVFLPCLFATNVLANDPLMATATVLEKMPAANSSLENELNAGLIKAGPDAIKVICDLIVPPGTGDDTKARYAISSLVSYTSRPDAAAEKKMYSAVLVQALIKASDKEVKSFFITQLQLVGDDDAVPEVSKYLRDASLYEPASFTLQTIGGDKAKKAFLDVLLASRKTIMPTIIHALGQMRVKEAVKHITKFAANNDRMLRLVSLAALAEIGDRGSVKVIQNALKVKDPYERGIVASHYVNLAKRLQETDRSKDAVNICEYILKSKDTAIKSSVKSSALSVIVDAYGSKADDYIEAAFDDGDDQLQAAAMRLVAEIDDSYVTKMWCKKLSKASSKRQVKIIEMLGSRGDKTAIAALRKLWWDSDKVARVAIVNTIVQLDKSDSMNDIMGAVNSGNDVETEAAKSLLLQLPTEQFAAKAIRALPNFPANGQVAIIEILAERRVVKALNPVFLLTASKDSSVNIAATKALVTLAGPEDISRVIDLMLNSQSSAQRSEASRVIVQLCQKAGGGSEATAPLLAAMEGATIEQQITVIGLLSSVGSKEALDIVVRKTKSLDPQLREAAIRSLAKWNNAGALDALLDIANTTSKLNFYVISLKAYAGLVASSDISPTDKATNFQKAFKAARRIEEKKYIMSRLSRVKSVETLAIAVDLLDDEVLTADAKLAVMKIALPDGRKFKGLKGPGVGTLLLDAYVKIDNKEIRKKLDAHIKEIVKETGDIESAGQKQPPKGFVSLFNGKDLTGWKGLLAKPNDNPIKRALLNDKDSAAKQAEADASMLKHWYVVDGVLYFDGGGFSLATASDYGDFEMLVDWKLMTANGDSGIYLRGSPQVQIWDPAHWKIGSGGLYNNKENPKNPLVIADRPIGQWNTFRIKMIDDKVTVHLNGKLVVDNVTLENYWDRNNPIFSRGQIELQCHGNPVCFRNVFIRQIPRKDEFISLFNGRDLAGWIGDVNGYIVEDSSIVCKPGGNLYTEKEYSDFVLKFKFKLENGTNNGLGIRTPMGVDAAYHGMEIQILDNTAKKFKDKLKPYQYHGSVYGIKPAERGYLKTVGQWNTEEVTADGNKITVVLNGVTIVEADLKEDTREGTMDGKEHPGLFNKSGHIGFLGHGSVVEFKDIKIKELN